MQLYQQIQARKTRYAAEIRTVSSLYTPGGVTFCNNLGWLEVVFNACGLICNSVVRIPFHQPVIGSLRQQSLTELMQHWLAVSQAMQALRVEQIATGRMPAGLMVCLLQRVFAGVKIRV